ncbi:MAG: hypothetical protein AB8G96_16225 [Phycisphaerales bacterium]
MSTTRLHLVRQGASVAIVGALVFGGGCAERLRQEGLESVAGDWLSTIRASQVMPVYPPTEDLEPGDVFLVTVPIQEQHELFERDDYVPLDMLGPRLDVPVPGYDAFYDSRYWAGSFGQPPHDRPGQPGTTSVMAPKVFFPDYSVDVATGGRMDVGIPLRGVPVGLELLGASSATATVSLRDTFTYALPGDRLLQSLNAWAADPRVRDMLGEMAAAHSDTIYLRCVNRVFLAQNISVLIATTQDDGQALRAGAAAGAATLETVQSGDEATAYRSSLNAVNAALADGVPAPAAASGGSGVAGLVAPPSASLVLRQRTRRTVELQEDLGQPLVIGYLGFDVPVLSSGDLGPPIATRELVRNPSQPSTRLKAGQRTVEEKLLRVALLDFDAVVDDGDELAVAAITSFVATGLGVAEINEAVWDPTTGSSIKSAGREFKFAIRRWTSGDPDMVRHRRATRLLEAAWRDATSDEDGGGN